VQLCLVFVEEPEAQLVVEKVVWVHIVDFVKVFDAKCIFVVEAPADSEVSLDFLFKDDPFPFDLHQKFLVLQDQTHFEIKKVERLLI